MTPKIPLKRYFFSLTFLVTTLVLGIAAFTTPAPAYASSTTPHCGTIAVNETWAAADNVHLVNCDVTVALGVTLTIEEGAIVKFEYDDTLYVNGKLVANGTASDPIYFTSFRDDSVGGDTNGDGASAGVVEDWGRIRFAEGSDDSSSIQYAEIRYSGNDGNSSVDFGALELDNASPTLQNITFLSNRINGAEVGDNVWTTDTWDNTDVVYYINRDLTIPIGSVLTIDPGVMIKFTPDDSLFVDGELQVHGTISEHVIFTSYRDDTTGGDTNNDGTSAGAVEDWGRIEFRDDSLDTSVIEYATIQYSGNDGNSTVDYGAITLDNASPVLRDITFANNFYDGAELFGGGWTTDTWDNTDVTYYVTGNLTVLSPHTITITATKQVAFRADVIIESGGHLVIQPGSIVKFDFDDSLFVGGKLVANGTASNPIYFTSYRDDSVGGDTNGDGGSAGAVEDWGRIRFAEGSDDTSSIQHAEIRYSGNDGTSTVDYGAIQLVNASPALQNITFVSNHINGAEMGDNVWTTDTWDNTDVVYYVNRDLTIPIGSVLTLDPGVIVKFALDDSLFVAGELQVHGTTSEHVIFTSYRDDTTGGDTNNDGVSAGAVEDWGRIRFTDGSLDTSMIEYATIQYSGNDGTSTVDYGAIELVNASPILQNITFLSNHINGVEVGANVLATDTWDNTDVVYYVNRDTTIPIGSVLTIDPGVMIKFTPDDSLFVDGELQVHGTDSEHVIFTSYRDDTVGGDTNNDGTSAGVVEDWGRVEFRDDSLDTSVIEYATIQYSGNDGTSTVDYAAIRIVDASPTINCVILTQNYRGIEIIGDSHPTISCLDIFENTDFGVYNDTPTSPVDAQNLWWGAASGPAHSGNPGGQGQSVSDGVNYSPWATQPFMVEDDGQLQYFIFLPVVTR